MFGLLYKHIPSQGKGYQKKKNDNLIKSLNFVYLFQYFNLFLLFVYSTDYNRYQPKYFTEQICVVSFYSKHLNETSLENTLVECLNFQLIKIDL